MKPQPATIQSVIVFVYRLPAGFERNSVIESQAESLEKSGIKIIRFPISNGGIKGYVKAAFSLFFFLRKTDYNLVHAHYFESAVAATLACPKKIIVSLMGSDVNEASHSQLKIIRFFSRFFWSLTIVKSREMHHRVPGSVIIPNGVDFNIFRPMDKGECQKIVSFNPRARNLIFVAEDITSTNKNFELAKKSVEMTGITDIQLIPVTKTHQSKLVYYYNAADALLFTSKKEGSPNVIKEAMACNCPIIATPAGDVPELLKDTTGCHIVNYDPEEIAGKIRQTLEQSQRTQGRDDIKHLDSNFIGKRILQEYDQIIQKKKK